MREVLLYGPIWYESAIKFIEAINKVDSDELIVRVNSTGGDVMPGWGMIAKFKEFEGSKLVKVDGEASSMGAYFAVYADEVEALDVSKFLFHRASYGLYYEENYMTDSQKAELIGINKDLEKALRAKVDVSKFESITDVKIKDIFSMDNRIDVTLTAKQAKDVGLVTKKIVKITPAKRVEINSEIARIAASFPGQLEFIPETPKAGLKQQKTKTMNIEELKKKYPDLYAQVRNEGVESGKTEGINAERDRVGAWSAFSVADAEAVQAGIKSGKKITDTERSEFMVKLASRTKLAAINNESSAIPGADGVIAEPPAGSVEPTEAEKLEAAILAKAGVETKK